MGEDNKGTGDTQVVCTVCWLRWEGRRLLAVNKEKW